MRSAVRGAVGKPNSNTFQVPCAGSISHGCAEPGRPKRRSARSQKLGKTPDDTRFDSANDTGRAVSQPVQRLATALQRRPVTCQCLLGVYMFQRLSGRPIPQFAQPIPGWDSRPESKPLDRSRLCQTTWKLGSRHCNEQSQASALARAIRVRPDWQCHLTFPPPRAQSPIGRGRAWRLAGGRQPGYNLDKAAAMCAICAISSLRRPPWVQPALRPRPGFFCCPPTLHRMHGGSFNYSVSVYTSWMEG